MVIRHSKKLFVLTLVFLISLFVFYFLRSGVVVVHLSFPRKIVDYLEKLWTKVEQPINVEKLKYLMKNLRQKEVHLVQKFLNVSSMSDGAARDHFYTTISLPLQGVCSSLKRFGGTWMVNKDAKAVDGDKFVCMDSFNDTKPCIIYSFGVG